MFKLPVFTIDQLVRRMETEYPQRIAMRCYDEDQEKVQEMTYGQYAHDIRCVAAELQDKIPDIQGKRVCILAANSYHYAASIFGTVLAGAVVVPLNRQKSWDDIQYEVNLVEAAAILHDGSYLEGHPNMNTVKGVDMSTGSLGQGVSTACGMALAAKMQKSGVNVFTLLGDGEIEEGQCWEAFMFASHYKLDNLCIMVDVNGLQIDGPTGKVMSSEPLDQKMDAFGFNTIVCNGNSVSELEQAFILFDRAHGSGKPTCFLLHTTKGLGVSYMENQVDWHGKAPNDDEYTQAMAELHQAYDLLEKEAQR